MTTPRILGTLVLVAGGALPITFVFTYSLMPLWRILERDFGIESVGHSGPASWCFGVVYTLALLVGLALLWRRIRMDRAARPAPP
jgi:hypothetical protein